MKPMEKGLDYGDMRLDLAYDIRLSLWVGKLQKLHYLDMPLYEFGK